MATITFEIPDNVEQHLAASVSDVDAAAKEAAVVELYRQGQLSHGVLAECLGLSRIEADAVLTRHHVTEDLLTAGEFQEQMRALRARLEP
jgi:hypothetical protein